MNDDFSIFSYTLDQAIEDGFLIHPYPEKWQWLLITPAIHRICNEQPDRSYDECLVPLLMDCIMQAQANRSEVVWTLEYTVAGKVFIAVNEKGGLTVMTPEEY